MIIFIFHGNSDRLSENNCERNAGHYWNERDVSIMVPLKLLKFIWSIISHEKKKRNSIDFTVRLNKSNLLYFGILYKQHLLSSLIFKIIMPKKPQTNKIMKFWGDISIPLIYLLSYEALQWYIRYLS